MATLPLADRMARLGTETAFEVLARARALEAQGRRIVHLEIGEPDFETAPHIKEAGKQAIDDGFTHYGPSAGLMPAREAVARYVARTRGMPVSPEQVVLTPGAKPILYFTLEAVVDPGDEVLLPDPGFPIYESVVNYLGATPVPVPLLMEREFRFDPDDLRRRVTGRTKLIILNSPQNPTGGVLTPEDLHAVADIALERDLWVLSDEIYSRLLYVGEHDSIATLPGMAERTVLLDGFSKTYAMTGWRMGYGVMPEWLVDAVNKLMVNSNSCTASFTQRAGIAALCGPQDEVEAMIREFRRRRDAFCEGLNRLPGFRANCPQGAFYAFPNIEATGMKSKELADALLDEAGVACLSGSSFGGYGEGFLRFSYANSLENLMEAVERMNSFLSRVPGIGR
jgi:aspartate aminotransferase